MSTKKILVVDDNAVILKGLTFKLRSAGYEVLEAGDGATAFKITRESNPDLLILDINFPADITGNWDGFTMLSWLERLNQDWKRPVIIITGEEGKDYEARAKAAGAVAFFRKPVDNDQLLKVIAREFIANELRMKGSAPKGPIKPPTKPAA